MHGVLRSRWWVCWSITWRHHQWEEFQDEDLGCARERIRLEPRSADCKVQWAGADSMGTPRKLEAWRTWDTRTEGWTLFGAGEIAQRLWVLAVWSWDPVFGSQLSCNNSGAQQRPLTLAPRTLKSSFGLCDHTSTHTTEQNKTKLVTLYFNLKVPNAQEVCFGNQNTISACT